MRKQRSLRLAEKRSMSLRTRSSSSKGGGGGCGDAGSGGRDFDTGLDTALGERAAVRKAQQLSGPARAKALVKLYAQYRASGTLVCSAVLGGCGVGQQTVVLPTDKNSSTVFLQVAPAAGIDRGFPLMEHTTGRLGLCWALARCRGLPRDASQRLGLTPTCEPQFPERLFQMYLAIPAAQLRTASQLHVRSRIGGGFTTPGAPIRDVAGGTGIGGVSSPVAMAAGAGHPGVASARHEAPDERWRGGASHQAVIEAHLRNCSTSALLLGCLDAKLRQHALCYGQVVSGIHLERTGELQWGDMAVLRQQIAAIRGNVFDGAPHDQGLLSCQLPSLKASLVPRQINLKQRFDDTEGEKRSRFPGNVMGLQSGNVARLVSVCRGLKPSYVRTQSTEAHHLLVKVRVTEGNLAACRRHLRHHQVEQDRLARDRAGQQRWRRRGVDVQSLVTRIDQKGTGGGAATNGVHAIEYRDGRRAVVPRGGGVGHGRLIETLALQLEPGMHLIGPPRDAATVIYTRSPTLRRPGVSAYTAMLPYQAPQWHHGAQAWDATCAGGALGDLDLAPGAGTVASLDAALYLAEATDRLGRVSAVDGLAVEVHEESPANTGNSNGDYDGDLIVDTFLIQLQQRLAGLMTSSLSLSRAFNQNAAPLVGETQCNIVALRLTTATGSERGLALSLAEAVELLADLPLMDGQPLGFLYDWLASTGAEEDGIGGWDMDQVLRRCLPSGFASATAGVQPHRGLVVGGVGGTAVKPDCQASWLGQVGRCMPMDTNQVAEDLHQVLSATSRMLSFSFSLFDQCPLLIAAGPAPQGDVSCLALQGPREEAEEGGEEAAMMDDEGEEAEEEEEEEPWAPLRPPSDYGGEASPTDAATTTTTTTSEVDATLTRDRLLLVTQQRQLAPSADGASAWHVRMPMFGQCSSHAAEARREQAQWAQHLAWETATWQAATRLQRTNFLHWPVTTLRPGVTLVNTGFVYTARLVAARERIRTARRRMLLELYQARTSFSEHLVQALMAQLDALLTHDAPRSADATRQRLRLSMAQALMTCVRSGAKGNRRKLRSLLLNLGAPVDSTTATGQVQQTCHGRQVASQPPVEDWRGPALDQSVHWSYTEGVGCDGVMLQSMAQMIATVSSSTEVYVTGFMNELLQVLLLGNRYAGSGRIFDSEGRLLTAHHAGDHGRWVAAGPLPCLVDAGLLAAATSEAGTLRPGAQWVGEGGRALFLRPMGDIARSATLPGSAWRSDAGAMQQLLRADFLRRVVPLQCVQAPTSPAEAAFWVAVGRRALGWALHFLRGMALLPRSTLAPELPFDPILVGLNALRQQRDATTLATEAAREDRFQWACLAQRGLVGAAEAPTPGGEGSGGGGGGGPPPPSMDGHADPRVEWRHRQAQLEHTLWLCEAHETRAARHQTGEGMPPPPASGGGGGGGSSSSSSGGSAETPELYAAAVDPEVDPHGYNFRVRHWAFLATVAIELSPTRAAETHQLWRRADYEFVLATVAARFAASREEVGAPTGYDAATNTQHVVSQNQLNVRHSDALTGARRMGPLINCSCQAQTFAVEIAPAEGYTAEQCCRHLTPVAPLAVVVDATGLESYDAHRPVAEARRRGGGGRYQLLDLCQGESAWPAHVLVSKGAAVICVSTQACHAHDRDVRSVLGLFSDAWSCTAVWDRGEEEEKEGDGGGGGVVLFYARLKFVAVDGQLIPDTFQLAPRHQAAFEASGLPYKGQWLHREIQRYHSDEAMRSTTLSNKEHYNIWINATREWQLARTALGDRGASSAG